jgi:uncharacterized membrane protein
MNTTTHALAFMSSFAFNGALVFIAVALFALVLVGMDLASQLASRAYRYVATGRHRLRRLQKRNLVNQPHARINPNRALNRSASPAAFVNHHRVTTDKQAPARKRA